MNKNKNYIMLNGKKIPLTDEQIELIQSDLPEKSPFDRAENGEQYCCIWSFDVICRNETEDEYDDDEFRKGNYCTDKNIMEQHVLHMLLNNLLWRYSMTHGGDEMEFDSFSAKKYYIVYDADAEELYVDWNTSIKNVGVIYFKSEETACAAIEEIVKPFIAEHPDFDLTKM